MKYVAILLTCYNRVNTTLKALEKIFNASIPVGYELSIYLVDDASPDNTGEITKDKYPKITVINGNGDLYWNGGMRLAWETAAKIKDYDFYIWMNDDTFLYEQSLVNLFLDYGKINKMSILTAACHEPNSDIFSYGGRTEKGPIIPNYNNPQECKYINGNLVLIPKHIYKEVGNLSSAYTHCLGDFDYGLRVIKNGYFCYTTSKYIAECKLNLVSDYINPEFNLIKRIRSYFKSKDINLKEMIHYTIKHKGYLAVIKLILSIHFRIIFPKYFFKLKKIESEFINK